MTGRPLCADKVVDIIIDHGRRHDVRCSMASKRPPINGLSVAQTKPFADGGHTLLAARYDNGFWIKNG